MTLRKKFFFTILGVFSLSFVGLNAYLIHHEGQRRLQEEMETQRRVGESLVSNWKTTMRWTGSDNLARDQLFSMKGRHNILLIRLARNPKLTRINPASSPYVSTESEKRVLAEGKTYSQVLSKGSQGQLLTLIPMKAEEACVTCHRNVNHHLIDTGEVMAVLGLTTSLRDTYQKIAQAQRKWVIGFSVVMLVLVVAVQWVVGNLTRPLRHLLAAAQRIAEGDLQARVEVSTRDELALLGKSFNFMAAKVQQRTLELEQSVAELSARQRITQAILHTLDLEKRLQIILDQAMALVNVESGSVSTVEGSRLRLRAHRGLSQELVAAIADRPPGEVLGENELAVHRERQGESRGAVPDDVEREGIQAWVNLPLKIGDRLIGVLSLGSRRPEAFGEKELKRLGALAEQLAVAITNARLYADAQKRLGRLATLREIDRAIMAHADWQEVLRIVMEKVLANLCLDAVAVSLFDHARGLTELFAMRLRDGTAITQPPFDLAETLERQLRERGEPVIIVDLEAEPRIAMRPDVALPQKFASYIGLPLSVRGEILGALHALTQHHARLSDEDMGFLISLAGQLALALDNARKVQLLRASEARYQEIFANVLEGIYQSNPDGRFLVVNPALVRMLGYLSAEELMAVNVATALYANPEDLEHFRQLLAEKGEVRDFHRQLRTRDGRLIDVSENARLIRDALGSPLYYEGTLEDTTERKSLERQLLQAQKMESVGTLAGGIAHDFNNILTGILGHADLAMMDLPAGSSIRSDLQEISKLGRRAATLISQLLAFSRRAVTHKQPLELGPVIKETAKILQRTFPETIAVKVNLAEGLKTVEADVTQMQQVLMNLCVNARDAMPKGGSLEISAANVTLDEEYCRQHVYSRPGDYVCIAVRDTGVGMTAEIQDRIFEPFFTTKQPGMGTGLGLAMVYGIVKGHGGFINVYSEVGQGSEFKIYLPATAQSGVVSEPQRVEVPSGNETILLVEDDAVVREVGRSLLEKLGYEVLTARDGEEAVEVFRAHRKAIAAVVSDVVMPKMGGIALAQALKEIDPRVRLLLMSGYSTETDLETLKSVGVRAFVQKPLTLPDLARRLRAVLDEKSGPPLLAP